jgi:hypothetical protein
MAHGSTEPANSVKPRALNEAKPVRASNEMANVGWHKADITVVLNRVCFWV